MKKIIKRNGTRVNFDKSRIESAINKAMISSGHIFYDVSEKISKEIEDIFIASNKDMNISEIEDLVYKKLIEHKQVATSKSYESYRSVQEFKRKENTTDKTVWSLLNLDNEDLQRENSNKNETLCSTQRDLIAGELSKDLSRRKLIPPKILQAHDEGILHWHDMDYTLQPMINCCLINIEDMLNNGTVINGKMVKTPRSFITACTITTQIMAQVASNQYGGQSITIKHLAKYLNITFDKYYHMFMGMGMSERDSSDLAHNMMLKELKDGVQTIRYQLSTLMTTNGQAPFATIYLEIEEGHEYEYEMALICEEMIKQRLEGMQNHKGQNIGEAFPKLVYLLDEHNCLEGGKYDYITKLAVKCSAKRLVPDYQSAKLMRENYGEAFPPMGCRSHLSPYNDEDDNLKWYGRFNQGVITINLPQIGILSNKDMDKFWYLLSKRLELCKEALLCRHNLLKGSSSNTSPIHWQHGAIARIKPNEKIDKFLENGYSTLSLGYIGIHELTQSMLGVSHTTKDGQKFALEVMNYLHDACKEWRKETGLGFSLYGTPAESLVYRFARIDKEKFGDIKNVTDHLYYSNSYHVCVREEIDAFSKLSFEAPFHKLSSGGCISYIEVPDMTKNLEALEQIVNFIYHNIQYAEINTKPDLCYECGYTGELQLDKDLNWYCPNCGNRNTDEMQVMRRTCGYIGTNYWTKGRTQEIHNRVLHL